MAETSGWAALDLYITERVVAEVKKSGGWRRDAASLRLLNTYWRQQMNLYIVSVQPHSSRVVERRDLVALKQFPNLTSLDLRPFYQAAGPSACANLLTGLPPLTELLVPDAFLCDLRVSALRRLTHMTRLELDLAQLASAEAMRKLKILNLRELSVACGVHELRSLNAIAGTLKSLTVSFPSPPPLRQSRAILTSAESLHLQIRRRAFIDLSLVSGLTNLVSLDVGHGILRNHSVLCQFTNLKHLRTSLRRSLSEPKEELPLEVLARLESLDVMSWGDDPAYTSRQLMQPPENLTSLVMARVDLTNADFHRLWRLKNLVLMGCVCPQSPQWIGALTRLESLCLYADRYAIETLSILALSPLPRLKKLVLHSCQFPFLKTAMACLNRMTALEVLGMDIGNHRSAVRDGDVLLALRELGGMARLRDLFISGGAVKSVVRDLRNLPLLSQLDTLWLGSCEENEYLSTFLGTVAKHEPLLRINTGDGLVSPYMYAHRFTWGYFKFRIALD